MGEGDRLDREVMPEHEETMPARKKRSKIVTVIVWLIVLGLVPMCGAWIIGRWVYWFDIAASQQMLISFVALAVSIGVLASRRWVAAVLCLILVCLSFSPVLTGRVWSLPQVDIEHKENRIIRVVTSNLHPKNPEWENDLNTLLSLNADVVILLEIHPELSRSIRGRHLLDSTPYTQWAHRAWVDQVVSPCFILSRWPMEVVSLSDDPQAARHLLYARISNPAGNFMIGLSHPVSPRTGVRWLDGNETTNLQAATVEQLKALQTDPILLCADLNAGPAQVRASVMRASGLRMSKPLLYRDGSFPMNTQVPKIMRVQLDDIWSYGNISPVAWSMIHLAGSDHQAVIADFVIHEN